MEETLAEIEFLALSPNRVTVLERLADGVHTRSELGEATGASQATLGRILGDFEERDWVRREGNGYVATATGRLVAEGFRDLLDVMAAERELRDVVAYLPTEALGFEFFRNSGRDRAHRVCYVHFVNNGFGERLLEFCTDIDLIVSVHETVSSVTKC